MNSLSGPFLAVAAALVVAFLTNFLAEDYRRFRDGASLAAAFAGELDSYMKALALGIPVFEALLERAENGAFEPLKPRGPAVDFVLDANAGRIGLLGPNLAGEIPFVYHQVRAFREIQASLTQPMDASKAKGAIGVCLMFMEEAKKHGEPLVEQLKKRSVTPYRSFQR